MFSRELAGAFERGARAAAATGFASGSDPGPIGRASGSDAGVSGRASGSDAGVMTAGAVVVAGAAGWVVDRDVVTAAAVVGAGAGGAVGRAAAAVTAGAEA